MYLVALSLAEQMDGFPGGRAAFAESVRGGVEALRPLRWPADRLDTLGGYLWYHNMTLVTLFLSIYAAVQGARALRSAEERHALEEILATGRSRAAVVRDETVGFAATLALVTLGLGTGVAASMAAAGASDVGGSFVSVMAAGMCALVAFALGLAVSQVTATSRAAAGTASLLLTVLYVGTNVAGEIGPVGAVRFLSPFHYANASRAIVPGHHLDPAAMAVLLAMAAGLVAVAARAFERRDYGATLWATEERRPAAGPVVVQRPMLGAVWTATLLRSRLGLLAWSLAAAAYMSMVASLEPTVMDTWSAFQSWAGMGGGKEGIPPATQYMSLAGELVLPIIAAYVVTQAAAWTADLEQGRVEMLLAAPLSWSRLVRERLLAAAAGVGAITAAGLTGLTVAAAAVGAPVHPTGLLRLAVGCLLFGVALGAVGAVLVAFFRTGAAVTALGVFLAASWLLGLLVSYLSWPEWVNRLSVFGAVGHPYLQWPPVGGVLVLAVLAVGGALAGAATAERSPKVA